MRDFAWLIVVIFALSLFRTGDGCDAKICSDNFFTITKQLVKTSKKYCVFQAAYVKCIELKENSCRGDIGFHMTRSSVEILVSEHPHCEELVSTEADRQLEADALAILLRPGNVGTSPHIDVCKYSGPAHMSHCSLYGDPHLVTLSEEHLTCVLNGAWPLLDTKNLAIQVTNKHISGHRVATAATKVTVMIKTISESCGRGVTYEASEDLPKAFVDGRTWAPAGWITEISPGNHVAINVVAINATVAIRKIDRFLQVHVSLPTSVVNREAENSALCSVGCPASQEINIEQLHNVQTTFDEKKAEEICARYNLTDHFLNSCMFDVMATGERAFGKAAFLAHQDMTHLNPYYRVAQKNCTNWPCGWPTSVGHSVKSNLWVLLILVVMGTLR